jgi:hypothetical protein
MLAHVLLTFVQVLSEKRKKKTELRQSEIEKPKLSLSLKIHGQVQLTEEQG